MKKTYLEVRSLAKTSKLLKISKPTLSKYLADAGVVIHRGRSKGIKAKNQGYHHGCLAIWLRQHPGKLLPRGVREISALTGCTQDEVKSYLYRRRISEKRKLQRLPFCAASGALWDVRGTMIPCAAFHRVVDIQLDPYTFEGEVQIELRDGQLRNFKDTYENFKRFLG